VQPVRAHHPPSVTKAGFGHAVTKGLARKRPEQRNRAPAQFRNLAQGGGERGSNRRPGGEETVKKK